MAVTVTGQRTPTAWMAASLGSPMDAIAIRCGTRHLSFLTRIEGVDQGQSGFPLIHFESSLVPHPGPDDWIPVDLPTGWTALRSHLWSRLRIAEGARIEWMRTDRPIVRLQARSADGSMDWQATDRPPLAAIAGVQFSGRSLDLSPSQIFENFDSLTLLEVSSGDPRVAVTIDTGTPQEPKPSTEWIVRIRATGSNRTSSILATATPAVGPSVTELIVLDVT